MTSATYLPLHPASHRALSPGVTRAGESSPDFPERLRTGSAARWPTSRKPSKAFACAVWLSHRSGLPGNAGSNLELLGYTRAELLRRVPFAGSLWRSSVNRTIIVSTSGSGSVASGRTGARSPAFTAPG